MDAIEQFLDLQVPQSVNVSPDGKLVIYATSVLYKHKKTEYATSIVWVAEVGREKSARQLTSGLFDDCLPKWAPDSKTIAFVSDRAKPGISCALYQFSLQGGEPVPLTSTENERPIAKFVWSPNGKSIAYLSADEKTPEEKAKEEAKDDVQVYGEDWDFQRLRLVHLSTKVVTTLVQREDHVNDLVWNPDSSSIIYTITRTPEVESPVMHGQFIEHIAIDGKKTSVVCKCPTATEKVTGGTGLHWLDDQLYIVANARMESVLSSDVIYSVSLPDGTWTRRAGGEVDCAAGLCIANKTVWIKFLAGLEDRIRTLDGKKLYSGMTRLQQWDVVSPPDKDDTVLAMVKSTINQPSEVFCVSSQNGGDEVQLSDHGHAFKEPIADFIPLSVKSSDGKVTLDGVFFLPKESTSQSNNTQPSKPLPTVVLPHGGPYSRTTNTFTPEYGWCQPLLRIGYAVMYPNYRGSSGRGADFAHYSTHNTGTVDYTDVIDLTQACIDQGLTDKDRILIGGWSQGGFLTYLAAVRNGTHGRGWRFKGCIAGAGITDSDMMVMTSDIPAFQADLAAHKPWAVGSENTDTRRASAIWEFKDAAEEARIPPMLLLHGEKDVRVPITQAWAFHRACLQYGIPCEMVTYPRAGHLVGERKQLVDMMQRIVRFVDQHLA